MEEEKAKEKKIDYEDWWLKNYRPMKTAWYSWNTPVGLGFVLVEIGVFLWLLHLANIIR